MKKGSSLMLASVLLLAALAGCSTGEDNSLVSKRPSRSSQRRTPKGTR